MTLHQIILKVLEHNYPNWTYGYRLRSVDTPYGWIGSSGDVRARELERAGEIEKRGEGKYIMYRYKQPEPVQTHLL